MLGGLAEKCELVDGEVVMMAGANRRHDTIVVNMLAALHGLLRGKPCRPFSSDTFVSVSETTKRLPDLGVDCGNRDDASLVADSPVLVVEVLSPSTADFDRTRKLDEYRGVASLRHILVVDTQTPSLMVHDRTDNGAWQTRTLAGLEAVVELPHIDVRLPLALVFEGLDFAPRPRLVVPPAP